MTKRNKKFAIWRAVKAYALLAMALAIVCIVAIAGIPAYAWKQLLNLWAVSHIDITNNNAELLSNLFFISGGTFTIILATWRITVSNRQAAAAEAGHRDGRFEKGAELMSAEDVTTRIAGIAALERLAKEYPNDYHVQCTKMISAFVRYRYFNFESGKTQPPEVGKCTPEIETAAKVIGHRHLNRKNRLRKIENIQEYEIDLSGSYLSGAYLRNSDFSYADLENVQFDSVELSFSNLAYAKLSHSCLSSSELSDADLSYARLLGANFTNATLSRANLSGAYMYGADLSDAKLAGANLSNAILQNANLACANLEGVSIRGATLSFANLSETVLENADMKGAWLNEANLSDAIMRNVVNLSQPELNAAFILRGKGEPDLSGSKCALTGRPLEWQGIPR